MAKYRVTDKMPVNRKGWNPGDVVDLAPEIATLYLAKGYIEQLDMGIGSGVVDIEEAKQDTQLRKYRHKESK